MTSFFRTLIAGSILISAGGAAFSVLAQTAPPAPTPAPVTAANKGMKKLDTNNDYMISREEAKARPRLSKNFDAIDTNKDGQLSRDEMKAYRQAHKGEGKVKP